MQQESVSPTETELREAICEVGRRMWVRSQVAANDGNISARMADGHVLCTPTGISKGFMAPEDIVKLAPDGRTIGPGKPSSEALLHLACYCARSDVQAVVHAHPPYATAFAALGKPVPTQYLTEIAVALWEVPCAEYGTPGTLEVPESALPMLETADAFLLRNHGVVTVAPDVWEAYYRMETVEQGAKVGSIIGQLGGTETFDEEQLRDLAAIRREGGLGVEPTYYDPNGCIERISEHWGEREDE
ncbi:MAG: class II aldolase/adducin family protein [Armatimonadia bacterium]|nr:class II aldolase/adducin family protein [Armatimonadia bacterium]